MHQRPAISRRTLPLLLLYVEQGTALHIQKDFTKITPLSISNSCFVRNKALSKAIVHVSFQQNVSQNDNYSHDNDIPEMYRYKDTCDGVFVYDSIRGFHGEIYEYTFCHDFEATACSPDPSFPVTEPPADPECIGKTCCGCGRICCCPVTKVHSLSLAKRPRRLVGMQFGMLLALPSFR
jgi:hypothetical protein